ncbi:gamma-glutamyl-gamma-aminobutyrate hydrolase family protein [Streptomyces diastatochromogenes]|uniref:Peptidase C26 n=1 Tax=Streptomyces diastatochromogenes TaxID=42236 RepID=A0A233S9X9_STRDA|nr:gamma-glutamyl-gamma-aminobutyrate hydrolase family protein [Streptomyces diastatochromogenes]OXY92490.1 peptidase C26 [Streptomyces diastatochromogenes]
MTRRPLIAVPARFSASAAALRYAAEVNARALIEAVYRAGGEPLTMHPHAPGGHADPDEIARRLERCDGLLLPGGGDLAPSRYEAAEAHASVYDVDDEQDAFDLALARHALDTGLPVLAICRGLQVVNTALGGTLRQTMGGPETDHRPRMHPIAIAAGSLLAGVLGVEKAQISCYHHQCLDRVGAGLSVIATADDGTVEAVERPGAAGWFLGVQWHPEDTAPHDPSQQELFAALIAAACRPAGLFARR